MTVSCYNKIVKCDFWYQTNFIQIGISKKSTRKLHHFFFVVYEEDGFFVYYYHYYYYFIVYVDSRYILCVCTVYIFPFIRYASLFTRGPVLFNRKYIFFPRFKCAYAQRDGKCILYNIYTGERMSVIFGQTSRACGIHLHPLRWFFIASIDFISRMTNQN